MKKELEMLFKMSLFYGLTRNWISRRNVILADEMGLGKTIQALSVMWWLRKMRNIRGPFLSAFYSFTPLQTHTHTCTF